MATEILLGALSACSSGLRATPTRVNFQRRIHTNNGFKKPLLVEQLTGKGEHDLKEG
jgi:hypothetical protein